MRTTSTPQVRRRAAGLVAGVASLALLAACGDPSREPEATNPAVTIATFAFTPEVLRVEVGATVRWTNGDDILHTVTSGTRAYAPGNSGQVTETDKDGTFDLQLDGRGAIAEHTFTGAGTYHYFCDLHPGMEADLEVS